MICVFLIFLTMAIASKTGQAAHTRSIIILNWIKGGKGCLLSDPKRHQGRNNKVLGGHRLPTIDRISTCMGDVIGFTLRRS